MDRAVTMLKAVSDRNRLRVVAVLMEHRELCACQITELLQVAGATASRHMGVLASAGIVVSSKKGRWVHYSLNRDDCMVRSLLRWLHDELAGDRAVVKDLHDLSLILTRGSKGDTQSSSESCCESV